MATTSSTTSRPAFTTSRPSSFGYQTVTVQAQRVLAGQTADANFQLATQALSLEGITVQGERNPLVPRDQTQTKAIITSEVLDAVPVEDVRGVVALQPGVVETGSALGQVIRGGRPGEAAVYLDGVLVRNFAVGSQSEVTLQANALEEVDVLLGGYGAEYGQAQSGVINLVSKGGGTVWSGAVSFETDQLEIENSYGYSRLEASILGSDPGREAGHLGFGDGDRAGGCVPDVHGLRRRPAHVPERGGRLGLRALHGADAVLPADGHVHDR